MTTNSRPLLLAPGAFQRFAEAYAAQEWVKARNIAMNQINNLVLARNVETERGERQKLDQAITVWREMNAQAFDAWETAYNLNLKTG